MGLLSAKGLIATVLIFLLATWNQSQILVEAKGGGVCGKISLEAAINSLSPCSRAGRDPRIKVPAACCNKIGAIIKNTPRCLCAMLVSPLAKKYGINPAVAVTIPKRCHIKHLPSGKECQRLAP